MLHSLFSRPFVGGAILALAVTCLVPITGCNWGGDADREGTEQSDGDAESAPVVEKIPGMKYYVGGPVFGSDKYGRHRFREFNGEISKPTNRGLMLGLKMKNETQFDFRTWLNGTLVQQSDGHLDDEGLLWFDKRFSYSTLGELVVRQTFVYNDDAQTWKETLEHIDPKTGEVIEVTEATVPYAPQYEEEDDDDDIDIDVDVESDGEGEGAGAE